MKKIKIGYLPLYIKLYDDSNTRNREPMERHMRTLVSMLESEGLEVVLELPDDRRIAEAYSRGELLVDALPELRQLFESMWRRIVNAVTAQEVRP